MQDCSATSGSQEGEAPTQLQVLMVEDCASDVELGLTLTSNGFDVSSEEAQTVEGLSSRIRATEYDVILADYNLPLWRGMDSLEVLRRENLDVPLIVVTGYLGEEKAVEQAVENLQSAIEESRAVVNCSELPMVTADILQLRQVFQNLIANAIRFHGPETPTIEVSAERKNLEWVLAVSDNGIGIPAENREGVFVIFRRLHSYRICRRRDRPYRMQGNHRTARGQTAARGPSHTRLLFQIQPGRRINFEGGEKVHL
jgi:signal transduction histidine kinase